MSTLSLQLDNEALRTATVQAMLGVLTPDMQAKLVEQAIVALLAPPSGTYGRTKSPIEQAFESAVEQLARAECARLIEADTSLRERINELLRATADKVLSADRDKLAQRMADAFVSSMRKDY